MSGFSRYPCGTTATGDTVETITLDNGILSCQVLTLGATLRTLLVPDYTGQMIDVVLGYDTVNQYLEQDGYLGAVVGRCANRISNGRFSLDGQVHQLACNHGLCHLHGGEVGFSHRVWRVVLIGDRKLTLTLDSPDGEEGYPGNLKAEVTYQLEGATLSIHYRATTDATTPCNLTNHSYFNLSGHGGGSILDHEITLHAAQFTPTDQQSIPLGTVQDVAGTPMDLRQPTTLGAHMEDDFEQLIWAHGYDHNFVIDGQIGTLRRAAHCLSPVTGITMDVETTLPSMQLYTANYLPQDRVGKGGIFYGPRTAFCLETQFFPDSPNQPAFPNVMLSPTSVYDHTTCFSFGVI